MSHTPGPWHVVSKFVGPLHIEDSAGETIAYVGHDDFPICSANAELIAKAPAMLDLLRRVLEWKDHPDTKGAFMNAWVHGTRISQEEAETINALWAEVSTYAAISETSKEKS